MAANCSVAIYKISHSWETVKEGEAKETATDVGKGDVGQGKLGWDGKGEEGERREAL